MKRVALLLMSVFALCVYNVNAQTCTPQLNPADYPNGVFLPPPAVGLPCAIQGRAYNESVEFVLPTQITTEVGGNPVTANIDSIAVLSVTGFPSEFTFTCNVPACVWPAGVAGCVSISSPNPQTLGDHTININARVYANISGIPIPIDTTISDYKIQVFANSADSAAYCEYNPLADFIDVKGNANVSFAGNFPNPFTNTTEIVFDVVKPADFEFTVTNVVGETVYENIIHANSGTNRVKFSADKLQPGIYFYTLKNEMGSISRRMVVTR